MTTEDDIGTQISRMFVALYHDKFEDFMMKFIGFTSATGDCILVERESQLEFYNYLNYLLGEVATLGEDGKVIWDGKPVIHTRRRIYVIELKRNGTAREALDQLEQRGEWKKYLGLGKLIYLVGVNYNSIPREIDSWEAKLYTDKGELQEERVPMMGGGFMIGVYVTEPKK